MMGAKQTKEDGNPTSPKSTSIAPVDHASGDDETPVPALLDKQVLLVGFIFVVIVVLLNVLIAIVSDSYDVSMAKAAALYYRSRLELITETAPIASRLPKRLLPTSDEDSIKKSITEALDEAKKDKSDDPNRINYTINCVEAIVDNRTRRLEAELAATRQELSEIMVLLQRVVEKVDA